MTSEIKTPAVLNENNLAEVAGWVTVFNTSPTTRECISNSEEFLAVGVGIPANSCLDKPLKAKKGFAVLRNTDNNQWEYQPDHRGETRYSTVTGEKIVVSDIGDYPADTTTLPPGAAFDKWDGMQWVADNDQIAALARQYRDAFITATDPMMVSDYCIGDTQLTEAQRTELMEARTAYRSWPTVENWPLIELPELPQWLLVEAVNQGYRVPVWPPLSA
ncbi:tail fiber assembly protein [Yersinia aldovae]|uniref:tail fiber assembly protein n=1 Tax=Yersinia aldovae TaxID=29483 RepID=UPI0011A8584F|nr:tail fiber assembly protein [Yersinia aldovae]